MTTEFLGKGDPLNGTFSRVLLFFFKCKHIVLNENKTKKRKLSDISKLPSLADIK